MGTDAATFARWHQDSLDDCSPEDRIWGWSIHSTEVIHYDHIKFDDKCLRKMLLQGLCDTAEGAPAWTEGVRQRGHSIYVIGCHEDLSEIHPSE